MQRLQQEPGDGEPLGKLSRRQALKIECWKCREVFTMSVELSGKLDPLVEAVIPCPFCETSNQVTVRADQVKSTILYRDGQSAEMVELEKPGALLGYLFQGAPLPSDGLMYYPPRPIPDPPPPKPIPPDKEHSK